MSAIVLRLRQMAAVSRVAEARIMTDAIAALQARDAEIERLRTENAAYRTIVAGQSRAMLDGPPREATGLEYRGG